MRKRPFFIGGSPCAGKSTIAKLLGKQLGWSVYHVDDHDDDHFQRSNPQDQPTFHHLMQLSGDDLWLRPVKEQFKDEIAFSAEPFPFILEDLAALYPNKPVIVEGAALLPNLVAQQISSKHQAVWLIPTEAFQRYHYAKRPWVKSVLTRCSDPEQAWENWMQRDMLFGHWVAKEAESLRLKAIWIDGTKTLEETAELISAWMRASDGT